MFRAMVLAALVASPITALSATRPGVEAPVDVEIRTSDSQELSATFYAPQRKKSQKEQPAPGVLLVHDAGGDRHQLDEVALRLQKSGFGVLTVDLRGHGNSGGKDKWSKLDAEKRNRLWALATRDVEASGVWLLSQDDVHSTNLSVVGLGSGCALAVRHARQDENVRCVALLAPRSQDFGFDVEADLLKIEGLPTLVLAAKDDDVAKAMVARANDGAYPYVELEYSAARVTSVLEDRKTPSKVASWIKGYAMPKRGRG